MSSSCSDVSSPFQTPAESAQLSVYTGTSALERPLSSVAGDCWGKLAEQGLSKCACHQLGKSRRDAHLQSSLTEGKVPGFKHPTLFLGCDHKVVTYSIKKRKCEVYMSILSTSGSQ